MSNKQEFHLPIETQKIAIYEKYRKDLKKEGNGDYIVDYSYFIKMWCSYHPDLKNAKKSRFGQCGTCSKQVAIINSLPKSNPEAIRIRKERKFHLDQCNQLHSLYHQRRKLAAKQPNEYHSICMDYVDSFKVPHRPRFPKDWLTWQKAKIHVLGLIDHSHSQKKLHLHLDHYHQDPNSVITALYCHVMELFNSNRRAPTLYLQTDNCFKENKNKYMLAFLKLLIRHRIYQQVIWNFLPVGHTHEDYDQIFVPLANAKWSHAFHTPEEFIEFATRAYRRYELKPQIIKLSKNVDWKTWLDPFIDEIKGHTKPLSFKIAAQPTKNDPDAARIWYKARPLDLLWTAGEQSNGIDLFLDIPVGLPNLVEPELLDLNDQLKHIRKYEYWFTETQNKWWHDFIQDQDLWINQPPFNAIDFENFWGDKDKEEDFEFSQHDELHPVARVSIANSMNPNINQVKKGTIAAVLANAADDPEAPKFWVGKVKRIYKKKNKILLNYFIHDKELDTYELDPSKSSGKAPLSSVLVVDIQLSRQHKIPARMLQKIKRLLLKYVD